MNFDRQIQIWGLIGQKLLQNTKICIKRHENIEENKIDFFEKLVDLLKCSGVNNIQFIDTLERIEDDSVYLIEECDLNLLSEKNRSSMSGFLFSMASSAVYIKSFFSKRLFIDVNGPKLNSGEIFNLLSHVISSKSSNEHAIFVQFFERLLNFIKMEPNRFPPIIPTDLHYFADVEEEDLVYLLDNCQRFCLLESSINTQLYHNNISKSINLLNEYMAAAYLASEIQKLITRKYLPETRGQADKAIRRSRRMDQFKLESHYGTFIKIGEGEFFGKNFKGALKSFNKAYEIAKQLKNVENEIKALDLQASCHEQLGQVDEALLMARKMLSIDPSSPIGYLRIGKLFRLRRKVEDAEKVYKIGLKKCKKTSQHYETIQKQLEAVRKVLAGTKTDKTEQIFGRGHFLSLPIGILAKISLSLDPHTLKSFSLTRRSVYDLIFEILFSGKFGYMIDMRNFKTGKELNAVIEKFDLFKKISMNSTFCAEDEQSTNLFLSHILKQQKFVSKISKLKIGPIDSSNAQMFLSCLRVVGKGLNCLKISMKANEMDEEGISAFIQKVLDLCDLKEFYIKYSRKNIKTSFTAVTILPTQTRTFKSLESVFIDGPSGNCVFRHCLNLKFLFYPFEPEFNAFLSDAIICAQLKYDTSLTTRPRPLKYLALNRFGEVNSIPFVDLNQYSYCPIEVLQLDSITFNTSSLTKIPILKSSNLTKLHTLRLRKILFNNPQNDITTLLAECPNLRVLELSGVSMIGGLNYDFNANELGKWLIEAIFTKLPNLEHLLLIDLPLGPMALNHMMKLFQSRTHQGGLKIVALIGIQISGYNFETLFKIFKKNYLWANVLTTEAHFEKYCEEYNIFYRKRDFLLIQ